MCLIIKCRICHDVIPTQDTRRKVCDKPECQRAAFLDRHKRKKVTDRSQCLFAFCKRCGDPIPAGSGLVCYCAKCGKIANVEKNREAKRARRK